MSRSTRPSWNVTTSIPGLNAFTLGDELAGLVDEGHEIAVLTADLSTSNKLTDFEERHPDRFYNFGIAEQNMMSAAAGMAADGVHAWASTFASFASLLCAEHLRTDFAYTGVPARVFAHHAGIAMGFYGTSHHATEDIALTRSIAHLVVMAPSDGPSMRACARASVTEAGPIYLRAGRGVERDLHADDLLLEPGRFVTLRDGTDVTLIGTGLGAHVAAGAAEILSGQGISARVLDAIYLKPFDVEGVLKAADETGTIVTVEEHNVVGGLGTAVADTLVSHRVAARLEKVGLADDYALVAPPTHLYRHYGLTPEGVAERTLLALGRSL